MKTANFRLGRPVALTLSVLAGGCVSLLWFLPQQVRSQQEALSIPKPPDISHLNIPPAVSLAEAQKSVSFPLFIPQEVPGQGKIYQARVQHLDIPDRAQFDPKVQAEQARLHSHPIGRVSYGVQFDFQSDMPRIRSTGGSPAERAGVPNEVVDLISVDGISSTGLDFTKVRQLAEKEPLKITFRDPSGKITSVSIPHKENYMFHPDMLPAPPQAPFDQYAIVYLQINGKQLALQESPHALRAFLPSASPFAHYASVSGKSVAFVGPSEAPSAYWTQDGVDFWFNNVKAAVSKNELVAMISSMQKIPTPQVSSETAGTTSPR